MRQREFLPHEWPIEDQTMPVAALKDEALEILLQGCAEKCYFMAKKPVFSVVPGPVSKLTTVVEVFRK